MRRAALIALVTVSGCARQARLVSDVRIDGYDLVIERCPVTASSSTGCTTERQPLPVVRSTRAATPAPPAIRGANYRNLVRASDALVPCATQHQMQGVLQVTLVIDTSGHVTTAEADGAPATFAECASASLASISFATSPEGTRVTFAWQVPALAQETP